MKRFVLGAGLALSLATVSFALPALEQLPGNLVLLAASDVSRSTFTKKLEEKGVTPEAALKMYPDEITARLKELGVMDLMKNAKTSAVGITADAKNLPNGFIVYMDGDFDAPGIIKKIAQTPFIQKEVKKDPAGEDVAVSIGKTKFGPSIVFTAAKDKLPAEVAEFYPPLAEGFTLTFEATAQNTLRFSSAGALPKSGSTLKADSPFAKAFVLEKGMVGREVIQPVDKMAAALLERIAAVEPEAKAEIDKITAIPVVDAFITMKACEVVATESANSFHYAVTFTAASEDKATEIQEAAIGYKVIAKTALEMAATQMPPEMAPMVANLAAVLASVKVGAPEGQTVTVKASITVDQYVAFVKALETFTEMMGCCPFGMDDEIEVDLEEIDADDE